MQPNPAQIQPPPIAEVPQQPGPPPHGMIIQQPAPQVSQPIPLWFPEPPAHYKQSFNVQQNLCIEDVIEYTKTFSMFGMDYDFEKSIQPQSVRHLDHNVKNNLKKLAQGITASMLGVIKVFSKPNHTQEEIKEPFKDMENFTNEFNSICKKIRINQINVSLMNKMKQDTVEIEKLNQNLEEILKKFDDIYFEDEMMDNSPAKSGIDSDKMQEEDVIEADSATN